MKKSPLPPCLQLLAIVCFLALNASIAKGQLYVDSLFSFQQTSDVSYGQAVDFAGNVRDLKMDICVPVGDNPGPNGRPLMLIIHGGGFLAGTKNDANIQRMMQEFAERGYLTAAINYRLGMFQTNSNWNCNVSLLGIQWNCLNQQDTSEWYRAVYRGAQDAHGAIRYLINNAATYQIDPMQVFVVGESAGGFIAMATAYLDVPAEKLSHHGALANALPPNSIYDAACVQQLGLDTNIASLQLSRPDLGPIGGTLNPTSQTYRIQAVGNFYGAMMQDLLSQSACLNPPALYTFHQFDDLVVPYNFQRVFAGYAYCMTLFPANCAYILNRPYGRGSKAIRDQAVALQQASQPAPTVQYDSTTSNLGCNQVNVPFVGHSIDNFAQRTRNMAVFFENYIGTSQGCALVDAPTPAVGHLIAYPNPTQGSLRIRTSAGDPLHRAQLVDMAGKTLATWDFPATPEQQLTLPEGIAHGLYLLQVEGVGGYQLSVISYQPGL
jgi:predicted esterase